MARFETAMDIGQKFWTIASYALYRDGKRMTARRIEEHEVQEIRIFGNEENDIAYCYDGYMRFSQSDIGSRVFLTEDDAKQEADLVARTQACILRYRHL